MNYLPHALIGLGAVAGLGLSYYACVVLDPRRTALFWLANAVSIALPLALTLTASDVAYENARLSLKE